MPPIPISVPSESCRQTSRRIEGARHGDLAVGGCCNLQFFAVHKESVSFYFPWRLVRPRFFPWLFESTTPDPRDIDSPSFNSSSKASSRPNEASQNCRYCSSHSFASARGFASSLRG